MTIEVSIDSFNGVKHVVIAEGVKGVVMANKDSLVTCERRDVAAAFKRMSGDGSSGFAVGTSTEAFGASEVANRSHRMRDVWRVEASDPEVEGGIGWPYYFCIRSTG